MTQILAIIIIIIIAIILFIKLFKNKPLVHQLSKGFVGLMSSRKGVLSLLLFAGSQIPMTILCFLGKIDGTSYGICVSAVTTAVVAIFCHTQSKTDQMLGKSQFSFPSTIDTILGPNGNMNNSDITTNVMPNDPPTT
jgi:hypothetical protein